MTKLELAQKIADGLWMRGIGSKAANLKAAIEIVDTLIGCGIVNVDDLAKLPYKRIQ